MRDNDDRATFVFDLDDPAHFLVAPDKDPFSPNPVYFMGQSAVERALRKVGGEKGWDRRSYRLVLRLPREKITPGLADQAQASLERFCREEIEDNKHRLAVIRRTGLRQIPYAFTFLAIFVSLGLIFGSDLVTDISPLLGTILSEGFFIVGWVSLWGPAETLLFDRFPIWRENRVLKALMRTEIDVVARDGD